MSNKFFDKYAVITTKDNKKINIKKLRIYVGGKKKYYGKKYIIFPDSEGYQDQVHFVDEVYSLDNNILRFLSDTLEKPMIINTIEHSIDNSEEKPITVIQDYEDSKTEILSIPDITRFESDLIVMENEKIISKDKENKKGFLLLRK